MKGLENALLWLIVVVLVMVQVSHNHKIEWIDARITNVEAALPSNSLFFCPSTK